MILCASCGSQTTYRPTVYGHDYKYGEIVTPVTHERISCRDEEFNKYVSFSLSDLTKVRTALETGEFPAHIILILEKFDKELKNISNKQRGNKPK